MVGFTVNEIMFGTFLVWFVKDAYKIKEGITRYYTVLMYYYIIYATLKKLMNIFI